MGTVMEWVYWVAMVMIAIVLARELVFNTPDAEKPDSEPESPGEWR